jgi:Glycosyltransferase family 87
MQGLSAFWKKTGFPVVAVLALIGGLGLYGYSFWTGRPYWPLSIDYSYLYVAGRLWAENISPYGEALPQAAHAIVGRDLLAFVYPPNWYALSRLLAFFDPATSNLAWFGLSTAMLGASAWLIAAVVMSFRTSFTSLANTIAPVEAGSRGLVLLALLFAGFVAATKGAGVGAYLGQTSMLAFFGQALLIYGATKSRQAFVVIGLVILLLKPQLGLAYAFVLLFDRRTWLSVLIACAITGVLALPALLIGGPVEVIRQFLTGLAGYGSRVENAPNAMSGVGNFLWLISGAEVSSFVWLGFAAVAGVIASLFLHQRFGAGNRPLAALIATTLSAGLLIPLHDWDFLLFAPLVGLLFFLDGWALVLALVATLLLTRFVEVVELLAPENTWIAHQRVSAMMATAAMMFATASAVLVAIRRRVS